MAESESESDGPPPEKVARKELTDTEKKCAFKTLETMVENGKLSHGAITKTAKLYCTSRTAMSRIWKAGVEFEGNTRKILSMDSARVGSARADCGRKAKYPMDDFASSLKKVPIVKRKTLRDIADTLAVPLTTLHRMKGREDASFRSHTNTIKSVLTEPNKMERLAWCMDKRSGQGRYKTMFDEVHVDEKWFWITETVARYYIANDEQPAKRSAKSKNFIDKIMFIAAVARPRWDAQKRKKFDGLIGIWPIGEVRPAKKIQHGAQEAHRSSIRWR